MPAMPRLHAVDGMRARLEGAGIFYISTCGYTVTKLVDNLWKTIEKFRITASCRRITEWHASGEAWCGMWISVLLPCG